MYCNFVSVTIKEEFPHSVSRSHIKNPFLRLQSKRRIGGESRAGAAPSGSPSSPAAASAPEREGN